MSKRTRMMHRRRQADPYTMHQDREENPSEKYMTGDPSEWAEDVVPAPKPGTDRDEIGLPTLPPSNYNHHDVDEWNSGGAYDNQSGVVASLAAQERQAAAHHMLETKGLVALQIAERILPKTASADDVDRQALSLMPLPMASLETTLRNLKAAAEDEEEGDEEEKDAKKASDDSEDEEEKEEGKDGKKAKKAKKKKGEEDEDKSDEDEDDSDEEDEDESDDDEDEDEDEDKKESKKASTSRRLATLESRLSEILSLLRGRNAGEEDLLDAMLDEAGEDEVEACDMDAEIDAMFMDSGEEEDLLHDGMEDFATDESFDLELEASMMGVNEAPALTAHERALFQHINQPRKASINATGPVKDTSSTRGADLSSLWESDPDVSDHF